MTLQKTRALQALKEINLIENVKIEHSENPITYIGNKKYSLVFPRFLINHFSLKKSNDYLFIGLVTPKRNHFLSQFPTAKIENSKRGRDVITKVYDIEYFNQLSNSKFILCPNGDFTWTYRFFESILCGSIPIIENDHVLYKGYQYFTKKDTHYYDNNIAYFNLNKLKREMML
jgi:hypothetical protein